MYNKDTQKKRETYMSAIRLYIAKVMKRERERERNVADYIILQTHAYNIMLKIQREKCTL